MKKILIKNKVLGLLAVTAVVAVLIAALPALAQNSGATPTPGGTTGPTITPTAAVAAGPQISIVAPLNNGFAFIGPIAVAVQVTGFALVDKVDEAALPGQGHIHYFMDVMPPTAAGQPATTTQGTWAMSIGLCNVWQNVAPGPHTFSAELVNNDHTPLVPPVVSTIAVTVTSLPTSTQVVTPTQTVTTAVTLTPTATPVVTPTTTVVPPTTTTTTTTTATATSTTTAPTSTTTTTVTSTTPAVTQTPTPSINAASLYASGCTLCHGASRQGGIGPALTSSALAGSSDSQITTKITNGSSEMPGFGNMLTPAQIAALVQFLRSP